MKQFFGAIWSYIKGGTSWVVSFSAKHKIIAGLIAIVIIGGGYWGYSSLTASAGGTEYVLAAATQEPLQITVTGSGQVSANDQLALTPQASGQVTEVDVTAGQTVAAGTVIARIDSTTADEAVETARENLKSAQISYQQTLSSSQTSLASDQTSLNTSISNTYSNIAPVMTGLDGLLHNLSTITGYTAEQNIDAYANYVNSAEAQTDREQVIQSYATAVASYNQALALNNADSGTTLTAAQALQLAQTTITATNDIDTAIRDTLAYYQYINAQVSSAHLITPTQISTQIASLNSYESTVTGDTTSLMNADTSLESDTQTLADNSNTPLTIQSAQLNVQKAEESLAQAEQDESNYVVTAPFDGVIANVAVKKYDQASSGTTIATLVTPDEYADLALNETDAAKVQVGQAATMTFDALATTTMQGTVASVSGIGTVSQGVVTYDVKIGFNTTNDAIKPGMTVDATIITASSTNAIQVPSAAVKTAANGSSYVEVATLTNASSTMNAAGGARRARTGTSTAAYGGTGGFGFGSTSAATSVATTRSITVPAADVTIKDVPVTIGLSNDTMVEITSGLTPRELVVTNTTTGSATTKTASSGNILSSLFGGSRRTATTGAGAAGGATGGASFRTSDAGVGAGFSGGEGRGGGG
jgi:HlyD family secretion protein